jgi:hypothetical protein
MGKQNLLIKINFYFFQYSKIYFFDVFGFDFLCFYLLKILFSLNIDETFYENFVQYIFPPFFCYLQPNSEKANLLIKKIVEEFLVSSFVLEIFLQVFVQILKKICEFLNLKS